MLLQIEGDCMSIFSGKCDFYDCFCAIGGDGDEEVVKENLKKLTLYVCGKDNRDHLVKSDTIKDIAKYYPYLETVACYNKEEGYIIHLSSDSFIDQEEAEHRQYMINDVMKYWRKCKREKREFTPEECVEKLWWNNKDDLKEIAERVKRDGNKAEFDDIHFPMWEHFRRKWFNELVRLGYTEREAYNWVFKTWWASSEEMKERLN